jgi:hypothetical protein
MGPDPAARTAEALSGGGKQFVSRCVDYLVDTRIDSVMPAAKQAQLSAMGHVEQVGRHDVHQRDLRAGRREQECRIDTPLPCSLGHPDEDRATGRV